MGRAVFKMNRIRWCLFAAVVGLAACFPLWGGEIPGLVDLSEACPGIEISLPYATTGNFTNKAFYGSNRAFLVPPAAKALAGVQADLEAEGFRLLVWDAYRPLSVQWELWAICSDTRYVASPQRGSRHNRGASVDVTLLDRNGNPVAMPTAYDDFSERAGAAFRDLPDDVKRNRRVLQKAMTRNGFRILDSEWWHFDFEGWREFPLLDIPISEAGKESRPTVERTSPKDFLLNSLTGELDRKGSRQALVVVSEGPESSRALVDFLERNGGEWRKAMPPFLANVGRKGIAKFGRKREGDGKTPSGLFRIGTAFGYPAQAPTKMPYLAVTGEDLWVDDPDSPDYNRLRKKGTTSALSFEIMRRKDDLYRFGLVVEYNVDPVIKGLGSAIFIHIWGGPGNPTAGCIAFPEKKVLEILSWLDPGKAPSIAIGTDRSFPDLASIPLRRNP